MKSFVGSIPSDIIKNPLKIISSENFTEVEEEIKKIRSSSKHDIKIIVTHSGAFHADEVMACCLLKYLPEFKNYIIIRSRNPEIWKENDCIVDVGGVFNPLKKQYDHHMITFNEYFSSNEENKKILLSASGLVYKYHGKEIIQELLKLWNIYDSYKDNIDEIYNKLYESLFMGIDAIDNGVDQYPGCNEKKKYKDGTNYSSRVSKLNPSIINSNNHNIQFSLAMDLADEIFLNEIRQFVFINFLYLIVYDDCLCITALLWW